MVPDDGSIYGAIPSSLFTEVKLIYIFSKMHDNTKSRLTSASIAPIKNLTCASYCYDKLTDLCLNNKYTRIVLNIVLTVYPESANGIGVRCKNHYSLFVSIYSKQMVSNLFVCQKYHKLFFYNIHLQPGRSLFIEIYLELD